ncbi:hypothetical protein AYK20_09815 [Thermoplasmatales archaeon SG8-52-1]|nr:MAG: hypothetical protein AYK20_09815 [Thermoplasmatales archaeon SG8-52-1]
MNYLLFRSPINIKKPGTNTYGYETIFYPPLGLMYIAASLEQNGHKVEIIDLGFDKFLSGELKQKLSNIDIVGLEVYTDNYKEVKNLAKKIKELKPNISIIIGGPHCIFFPKKSILDVKYADIAIVGEGEETINDVSLYLQGKKNISDIYNIYYKKNEEILPGKGLKFIKNLDSLPFPSRHLVEKYDYDRLPHGFFYKKKLTLMITSRGCPFHCHFCGRYSNSIENYNFRQRSTENIVEEILNIQNRYNSVMIIDDSFLCNLKKAHRIFDMLIEYGSKIEILILGARVDTAERELYKKMKKANVTYISFGIESGNQDVLDFYNKKVTLNQIRKAVLLSNEMGFQIGGTLILGAPIETKYHFKKTIKFSKTLPIDNAIFSVLKYEMGSYLWKEAVKNGKIGKEEFLVPANSLRGLGNFTLEELTRFTRNAYIVYYLRPRFLFVQIKKCLLKKDIGHLGIFLRFLFSIK